MTEEFMVGHTKIRIADDYCAEMTRKNIERTLASIVRTARRHLMAAERNGRNENPEHATSSELYTQNKG